MGGSKNRIKKALTPSPSKSPETAADDNDLMDDLFAQLDSKDETVQAESANVLQEITAPVLEKQSRKDPKSRFQARMVCGVTSSSLPIDHR
jgi:OTU domain-containing protein 6